MLYLLFLSTFILTLSLFSLLFLSFSLYGKLKRIRPESLSSPAAKDISAPALELTPVESEGLCGDPDSYSDPSQGQGQRRRKKRAKKKSKKSDKEEEQSVGGRDEKKVEECGPCPDSGSQDKPELICLYPFTSSGSATQRRIKQQYDELVKCHESKGLTLVQVGSISLKGTPWFCMHLVGLFSSAMLRETVSKMALRGDEIDSAICLHCHSYLCKKIILSLGFRRIGVVSSYDCVICQII